MESKVLQLVHSAYQTVLGHLRSRTLYCFKEALDKALNNGEGFAFASHACCQHFMTAFDEGCADAAITQAKWDTSKVRDKLKRDIDAHITELRTAKLAELNAFYERKLNEGLAEPVKALLEAATDDTWPAIRKILKRETELVTSGLSSDISGFDIDQASKDKMLSNLEEYARNLIESKAKEEAGSIMIHMKDRFSTLFSRDSDSMPRVWTGKEDIRAITKTARSASLKMLSVMAAIRLDDKSDNIDNTLSLALVETNRSDSSFDPLASSSWDEVSPSKTLLTPVKCKSLWRQFKVETEYVVTQALSAQEANKRNNNWLPPPWAIAAILILGFNEFMTLLRNPFYLGILFVLFLLSRALWVQMDITGIFQNGVLPGIMSISTKFVPTVLNILKILADKGHQPAAPSESRKNNELTDESSSSSTITTLNYGVEHSSSQVRGKSE